MSFFPSRITKGKGNFQGNEDASLQVGSGTFPHPLGKVGGGTYKVLHPTLCQSPYGCETAQPIFLLGGQILPPMAYS